ncbi:hypothetical protein HDU96_003829 [Phlyctochytrium bullatum]|nr:hypothetical protein HDU96_003829 [Phlyctochytrium bullatum]
MASLLFFALLLASFLLAPMAAAKCGDGVAGVALSPNRLFFTGYRVHVAGVDLHSDIRDYQVCTFVAFGGITQPFLVEVNVDPVLENPLSNREFPITGGNPAAGAFTIDVNGVKIPQLIVAKSVDRPAGTDTSPYRWVIITAGPIDREVGTGTDKECATSRKNSNAPILENYYVLVKDDLVLDAADQTDLEAAFATLQVKSHVQFNTDCFRGTVAGLNLGSQGAFNSTSSALGLAPVAPVA